jgi:cell division protein FtsB
MINKSLALKNKAYLFFILIISLFIFFYLLYFLINGQRGIISFFKISKLNDEHTILLSDLEKQNDFYSNKIERLKTNSIDLDFLDEKLREKTGFLDMNELLILF